MVNFFDRLTNNFKFVALLLLIVTLLAYGQTLQMYFWIDDNAVIYKLQHMDQNIGYWGRGIVGEGPYRHIINLFVPFYPFFKTNPTPYYAVGIVLYYFASIVVYFFVNRLTKNKLLAFISSLVFASGYVGSDSIYGITNSWQTSRGIIMTLFTFYLYYIFLKKGRLWLYLASVILFYFSLDTVYIRAHGLIFAILVFDLLYSPIKIKLSLILKYILRVIPFLYIHYYIYLTSLAYAKGFGVLNLLKDIIEDGQYYLLTIFIQDIGNLFIPDVFSKRLDSIFGEYIVQHNEVSVFSLLFGLVFFILSVLIIIKSFKREPQITKLFSFSVVWIVSSFVVFYLRETNHTLWTTHRYFTYSFVGIAIYWATGLYLIFFDKKLFLPAASLIVLILLSLGIIHQKEFNEKRSIPAKDFFASFTREVPSIPVGAVTYFDLVNDNQVRGRFGSFFGGMFSEASNLAIYNPNLDYMKDFIFTYKFDDILTMLADKTTSIDKVFTFYYKDEGLVNTTHETSELLTRGRVVKIDQGSFSANTPFETLNQTFKTKTYFKKTTDRSIGENPEITILPSHNTPSVVPSVFSFSMRITPQTPPLPYATRDASKVDIPEKTKIFSYLLSQTNFRRNAKTEAASHWKDQEPKLALDGRLETAWRGHRGYWDDIDRGITDNIEFFRVDLKRVLTVGQIRWVSAQRPLVPTHYRILVSVDGREWSLAKEVRDGKVLPEGTVVTDSFSATRARFVKMEVLKTYGNDGPEMKEFEVIESQFTDLDGGVVERVRKEPFGHIESKVEYTDALSFVKQNAQIRFYFMSDADAQQDLTKYIDLPLILDGKEHEYSVQLPATGLNWTKFTITGFNFPTEINVKNARIVYQSVLTDKFK